MSEDPASDQPVVVVTGGGAGIGAAVAEELGRTGWFVVTVDPLVTLDGSEQLPPAEETTAGRIIAAGGSARASSVSVTDRAGIRALFDGLVDERGRLDAVINAAGISRPTSFTTGTEVDWLAVLSVHLDGYLNVLHAALPIMAAAGRGRILGVTSGSGWRQANAGAYGCAKRAVAALTWQLGAHAPDGVAVNAMSPIAVTRMVTAALGRAGGAPPAATPPASGSGPAATGGLSLGSMPTPTELGPMAAHLVSEDIAWCHGQLIFVGGSEVAVIDQPRLLEVVRTVDVASLPHLLERFVAGALIPAEAAQASGGGSNPRFGPFPDAPPPDDLPPSAIRTCVIVSDRAELATAIEAALDARGVTTVIVAPDEVGATSGFEGAAAALGAVAQQCTPIDAVVVAFAADADTGATPGWEQTLHSHDDLVARLHADISWVRAVADHAAERGPIRVVTLTDAASPGGRTRAQVSAQLARAAQKATKGQVAAFAVGDESSNDAGLRRLAEVTAHLLCSEGAITLSGAELATGDGWFGIRAHPHPTASITFGGPAVPPWLDDVLRDVTA